MGARRKSRESAAPPSDVKHINDLLDEALDETFPASDPIAVEVERVQGKVSDLHPARIERRRARINHLNRLGF